MTVAIAAADDANTGDHKMDFPPSEEVRDHENAVRRRQAVSVLESRLRRRLRDGRLRLHKTRGDGRSRDLLGRYWVTDVLGVMPILRNVDLFALAKQTRVYYADLGIE
jgi:hypothetical protein